MRRPIVQISAVYDRHAGSLLFALAVDGTLWRLTDAENSLAAISEEQWEQLPNLPDGADPDPNVGTGLTPAQEKELRDRL